MTTIKRSAAAVLILIMAVATPGADRVIANVESDKAPYLYYYSDRLNAFVIERADGTDARVIGKGVSDPLNQYGNRYGSLQPSQFQFSPSGEWVAWKASRVANYYGGHSPQPYLMSIKGVVVPIDIGLPPNYSAAALSWSPVEDTLLVVGWNCVSIENQSYLEWNVVLFTPATGTMRSATKGVQKKQDTCYSLYVPFIQWSANGTAVFNMGEYEESTDSTSYYIVDSDGTLSIKQFQHFVREVDFDPAYPSTYAELYPEAQDKIIVTYLDERILVVEDLVSGEVIQRFDLPIVKPTAITLLDDKRHAIVYPQDTLHPGTASNYMLDLQAGTYYPIQSKQHGFLNPAAFSKDGKYYIALGDVDGKMFDDETKIIYLVTLATGEVRPISDPNVPVWFYKEGNPYIDGEEVIWKTFENEQTVLHFYNMESGKEIRRSTPFAVDYFFRVSPDRNYVAYFGNGIHVVDLRTQQHTSISPNEGGRVSNDGREVVWSDDSNWLMTYDDFFISGGGGYFRDKSVVSRDGSTRRRLNFNGSSGWLPAEFDMSKLPKPLPNPIMARPVFTYRHQYRAYMYAVGWSPDSREILVGIDYSCSEVEGSLTIRDFEKDQVTCIEKGKPYRNWIKWVDNYGIRLDESIRKSMAGVGYNNIYSNPHPDVWQIINALPYETEATAISPDRKYVAVANGWDVDIYRLSDPITW